MKTKDSNINQYINKVTNYNLKLFLLITVLAFSIVKSSAIGQNDSLALVYVTSDTAAPVDCYVTNSDGTYWIKFHSDSTDIFFENQLPDTNYSKISEITLYSGTPGNLTQIVNSVFNSNRDSISEYLFSGLTINSDYYLKVKSYNLNSNISFSLTYLLKPANVSYLCPGTISCSQNLIIDGDFESAPPCWANVRRKLSPGVTSQLNNLCVGNFGTNQYAIHNGYIHPFGSSADNTPTGNGYYFWGDCKKLPTGGTTGVFTSEAWKQSNIAVSANTEYIFEMFRKKLGSTSRYAVLKVLIEEFDNSGSGISTNSTWSTSLFTYAIPWTQSKFCITTLPTTVAVNITIYCSGNNDGDGYDFGLDDISFSKKCCLSPFSRIITTSINTSTLPLTIIGDVILVKAGVVLTVNTNTTLINCRVILEKGARIDVDAYRTLTLIESHLQSCGDMWNGIGLGNASVLYCTSSIIENAIHAISCSSNSTYTITNSIFNKNVNDIWILGTGFNVQFTGTVSGSVFTCRNIPHPSGANTMGNYASVLRGTNTSVNLSIYPKTNLGSFPNLANPYSRSQVAIEILNVGSTSSSATYNLTIGDASADYATLGNLFDNHDYGIKANKSNVRIVNNVFQEMSGNDYTGYSKGIGVWAYNKTVNSTAKFSIKIGGPSSNPNERNSFINCGTGVLISEYTYAIVSNNVINKIAAVGSSNQALQNYFGRMGIKITNSKESYYDCNENIITNCFRGIEWAQSVGKMAQCNFNNNVISVNTSYENCETGIFIHTTQWSDELLFLGSFIHINNNIITYVWTGIKTENITSTAALTINENPIYVSYSYNKPEYGINASNCFRIEVRKNTIHSTNKIHTNIRGILLNRCFNNRVNCNTIYNLGTCVAFDSYSHGIGGVLYNNVFSNYSVGVDITPGAIFQPNQGGVGNPTGNQWTNPGLPAVDIRNYSGTPCKFYISSSSAPYVPSSILPIGTLPQVLTQVTTGTSSITCTNSQQPISMSFSVEDWILIRKFAQNEVNFSTLNDQNKWMYAYYIYEKLLNDTTIDPSDSIIVNFIDSIENSNIGKFYYIGTSIKIEDWTQAESDNQAIVYTNHIEDNLKKFNSYYIQYHSDTILTGDSSWLANMFGDLSEIAAECDKTGGPAVSSARTMLSYFSNELFTENEDCFRSPSDTLIADSTNSSCDLIKSYSVPATAGATYTWTVPSGTNFTQSANTISINWGSKILNGGTITCSILDTLGNISVGTFMQDTLITSPTCVSVIPSTSCLTTTSLNWTAPAGCAAGYYILFGTNGGGTTNPNNIMDTTDIGNVTSYDLHDFINPSTTYYYKIIPYNNSHIPVSGCSIGSFTSGSSVAFTPTLGNPYQENFDGVIASVLPCGMTVSNENFPQDNFVWETSSSASCSGNNSIAIAKNPNNSTAKNDWVYSHPLNLTAGELYRVKYKRKAQSGFTESLTTYMSTNPDAATMLTTSAINNSSIATTSCGIDSGDFISPTSSNFFVGLHANSNANQSTIFVDDLNVSLIKTTHIKPAKCGINYNTCDRIECETYTGATSYKFKFEDLSNSFSSDYVVSASNPYIYQFFQGSNPLILGRTYTVFVAASNGGGVWSPFGSGCEVYINPVPIRSLTGASCGDTLSDLSQLIYTNTSGICLISNYKYEFTDQSNNTIIETERNSAVTSFLMTYITSPYVKYSTTYSVRVKLKIGNTWGEYGTACNITTPASPLTKLSSTYCNYTLPTFSTPVTCVSVLGAQDYRYKITGPNSYDRTFTRNSSVNNWYFTWTNSSPYMQANTTYDVKVASLAGGVWSDYGDVCTITTPATLSRLADTTFLQQALKPIFDQLENNENALSLSVFPNPNNFEEKFSIELSGITQSNQKVKFSILNMVGASVFRSDIITIDESRVLIQPEIRLASGVYIVEMNLNGEKLRKKFVVN